MNTEKVESLNSQVQEYLTLLKDYDEQLSNRTFEHRQYMLNDFVKYLKGVGKIKGGLSSHMTKINLLDFFRQRLLGLSVRTKENYIRSFGSMINSLSIGCNLNIESDKTDFNELVKEIKLLSLGETRNREILSEEMTLVLLTRLPFKFSVLAELQLMAGFRVHEAINIINNKKRHLQKKGDRYYIIDVISNGGGTYVRKEIPKELMTNIKKVDSKISMRSYQKALQNLNVKSKTLRFTYEYRLEEQGESREYILKQLNIKS